jgi:hypothetical protein
VNYAKVRQAALQVFLSDPEVPIDTNHLERGLRPIPLGLIFPLLKLDMNTIIFC